jgi:hypothetical protein
MRNTLLIVVLSVVLAVVIAFFGSVKFRENLVGLLADWLPANALKPDTPPLLAEGLSKFEDRLKQDFPVGSSGKELEQLLRGQGFVVSNSFTDDPHVHRVTFSQTGGGLRGPYPVVAIVQWLEDSDRRLKSIEVHGGYKGP